MYEDPPVSYCTICVHEVCINKCILYEGEHADLHVCPVCSESRSLHDVAAEENRPYPPRRRLIVHCNASTKNQRFLTLYFDEGFVTDLMFATSKSVLSFIRIVNESFTKRKEEVDRRKGFGGMVYETSVEKFLETLVIQEGLLPNSEDMIMFHEIADVIKF